MDDILTRIKNCGLLSADGGPVSGAILAGSAAYQQGYYKFLEDLHDLDFLFITPKKENFIALFDEKIEDLKKSVGIEICECSTDIFKKALTPEFWEEFDSIRFSGYSKNGQKITIKIIDSEFIRRTIYTQNRYVRLLSFKRISTFHKILDEGLTVVTIASLDKQLTINGKIINILNQFLLKKIDSNNLIIGVFSDMILAGHKLYDFNDTIENIRRDIICNIGQIRSDKFFLNFLNRIHVMPDTYVKKLMKNYSQKSPKIIKNMQEISIKNCSKWQIEFLPKYNTNEPQLLPNNIFENIKKPPENFELILEYVSVNAIDFPTAHKFGKAFLDSNEFCFFKETSNYIWEMFGFHEAQKYFSNIQPFIHCIKDQNICLYQWIYGDSIASSRMKLIIKNWVEFKKFGILHPYQYEIKSDLRNSIELITDIELFRAEEMLKVYRNSKTLNNTSGIHNVFQNRFIEKRFYNNYKNDIFNFNKCLKIDIITELPLIINGKKYNNLNYYIKKVQQFLSFKSFKNDLKNLNLKNSFGFGDTHSGNIMILNQPFCLKNKFVYIDYECSGYHSPFLDLCKGFAIDVFFNIYQLDVLLKISKNEFIPFDVNINVDQFDQNNLAIFIDHKFVLDWISYFSYKTKFCEIFEPLISELKDEKQSQRAWDIFKSGIFCSLLFAKKFPLQQQLFLMIAVAVEIFEADFCNLEGILKPMI